MALYRLSFNHAGYVLPFLTMVLGAPVYASDAFIPEATETVVSETVIPEAVIPEAGITETIDLQSADQSMLASPTQGEGQVDLLPSEDLAVIKTATTSAADLINPVNPEGGVNSDAEEPVVLAQADGGLVEAEDDSGWYASITPAVVLGYSLDGDVIVGGVPTDAEIDTESGFGVSGAVGYQFDENFQAEFEVAYNRNEADSIETALASSALTGNFQLFTFMVNGYYNIPTETPFTPYVGAGVGAGISEANDVSAPAVNVNLDGSATSFVFQVKTGVNYEVTDTLSAFLGYRLYGLPGVNVDSGVTEFDVDTTLIHSIQLGARYLF